LNGPAVALNIRFNRSVAVESTNQRPVVSAGADQKIDVGQSAVLQGSETDDGQPSGADLTKTWSQVGDGPGAVPFSDPHSTNTAATFSQGAIYVLRLTADDTLASVSADVAVRVNTAPVVAAGSKQTVRLPDVVALNVHDDGLLQAAALSQI